ncbi:unnamed protein product [Albugo candida]|uniref:MARVEL domain-containing protein n=1 Tax=Albugo candida TaxID=65357 RepID=A0A024GQ56_9STRA|nr:unnamed protein product [Albugo candida]|eukprot:CCI48701.1 unnamed protein product [Albugo candida]
MFEILGRGSDESDSLSPARIVLRGSQAILSMVAILLLAASFPSQTLGNSNQKASLGSSTSGFAVVLLYTSLISSSWYLTFVEISRRPNPIAPKYTVYTDGAMTFIYLITGIALASSSYVSHCDDYEGFIRCGVIKGAVALVFFLFFSFGGSTWTSYKGYNDWLSAEAERDTMEGNARPTNAYLETLTPKTYTGPGATL